MRHFWLMQGSITLSHDVYLYAAYSDIFVYLSATIIRVHASSSLDGIVPWTVTEFVEVA